jgi:hypothetical protein
VNEVVDVVMVVSHLLESYVRGSCWEPACRRFWLSGTYEVRHRDSDTVASLAMQKDSLRTQWCIPRSF